MKILFKIILIGISINSFGQNGITFEIEKLSKPERILYLQSYEDIYKNLILEDVSLSKWDIERNGIDFKYNILAKSQAPDSLVNFGYNSFFNGMYQAYAEHRPFVLSPDMIWLLINQGFARHVNANPEKLRKYFVDFSGKLTLVVNSKNDLLKDSTNWEEIFPQFTSQIAEHDILIVPDALKRIRIANLTLVNETSPENIEKLKKLLPETNIYMQGKKINNAR